MNPHNIEHGMLVLNVLLYMVLLVVGFERLKRTLKRKKELETELMMHRERTAVLIRTNEKLRNDNSMLRSDENLAKRMPMCESLRKRDLPESKSKMGVENTEYAMRPSEEVEMMDEINRNYNNFGMRLMSAYPTLKDKELTTCCLMLLKIKVKNISVLMGETYSTTLKRRQKLVETFGTENPDDFVDMFARDDTETEIPSE